MVKEVSQVPFILINPLHIWFTVFIRKVCTRMKPCSAVWRGHFHPHTNKSLPSDGIDFQYCHWIHKHIIVVVSAVSASHHQQSFWSLANVSSVASNICRWRCCSHSAADLFEFQQIPISLNLPSFKVQGPLWKTALKNERREKREKGESQREIRKAWAQQPGVLTKLQTKVINTAHSQ